MCRRRLGMEATGIPGMDATLLDTYRQMMVLKDHLPMAQWSAEMRTALRHVATALAAEREAPFFPPLLYVEPTNACNCNCVICSRRNMTRPVGFMDLDLFRRIIDGAAALGPSEIRLFNFGEPLLHDRLPDMVRHCRNHRLTVRVQTNGVDLSPTRMTALLEAGLDYLGVSVNGLRDWEYELIRPGFKFADLQADVRQLRVLARESGKPLHIHVNAQIVKEEVEERRADIDRFVMTWHGLADSLSVSGLEVQEGIDYVSRGVLVRGRLSERTRTPDSEVVCTEPFERMVVKWDGRATACCADYDAQATVGDLTCQSVAEAWNSPAMQVIRAAVRARDYSRLSVCRTCCKFYSGGFSLVFERKRAG